MRKDDSLRSAGPPRSDIPLVFGEKLGAGGSMDRAVDPASAEQRGICVVDERIDLQARDVSRRKAYPLREMRK